MYVCVHVCACMHVMLAPIVLKNLPIIHSENVHILYTTTYYSQIILLNKQLTIDYTAKVLQTANVALANIVPLCYSHASMDSPAVNCASALE